MSLSMSEIPIYGTVLLGLLALYVFYLIIATLRIRIGYNGGLCNAAIRSKKDLQGYKVIVTGSNQGIGYEIAKYMVLHGAHVVLACRNDHRGKEAEASINQAAKSSAVYNGGVAVYMNCDLSSFASTRAFIAEYTKKQDKLHILMNNAGKGGTDTFQLTEDGIEITWQTNYLSHFLLTHLLTPLMIESSVDEAFECRIVNTSSKWHAHGHIDLDIMKSDVIKQQNHYKGIIPVYGDSKLAQIMHMSYLQREVFNKRNIAISTSSVHPGAVRTNIFSPYVQSCVGKFVYYINFPAWYLGSRSQEQGSRTNIYCAVAPIGDHKGTWGGEFVPGAYHDSMKPHATKDKSRQSTDVEAQSKLYQYSLEILNLTDGQKDVVLEVSE